MSEWHCQCGWSGQGEHSHEATMKTRRFKTLDDEWEQIAEEAIHAASEVDCSLHGFRDGLKEIIGALMTRLEQVEDELKRRPA